MAGLKNVAGSKVWSVLPSTTSGSNVTSRNDSTGYDGLPGSGKGAGGSGKGAGGSSASTGINTSQNAAYLAYLQEIERRQ